MRSILFMAVLSSLATFFFALPALADVQYPPEGIEGCDTDFSRNPTAPHACSNGDQLVLHRTATGYRIERRTVSAQPRQSDPVTPQAPRVFNATNEMWGCRTVSESLQGCTFFVLVNGRIHNPANASTWSCYDLRGRFVRQGCADPRTPGATPAPALTQTVSSVTSLDTFVAMSPPAQASGPTHQERLEVERFRASPNASRETRTPTLQVDRLNTQDGGTSIRVYQTSPSWGDVLKGMFMGGTSRAADIVQDFNYQNRSTYNRPYFSSLVSGGRPPPPGGSCGGCPRITN